MVKSRIATLTIIVMLMLPVFSSGQAKFSTLKPSKDYWDHEARNVRKHITKISRSRKLVSVGDTLYMLDNRNNIIWMWTTEGPPLTDIPIIDSDGIIYVIAFDLIWAALDSETGKEKWRGTANGRAVYSQIKLYDKNTYLVVTYMEGYREMHAKSKFFQDRLSFCNGDAILWETDIPAGSQIEVRGRRVFAVYKYKKKNRRKEILIPRNIKKAIGKINYLADYE